MIAARFFRRLKRGIGIYGIALPIENVDQFMKDIVEDTTLPVFSIYHPRYEHIIVTSAEFKRASDGPSGACDKYILPQRLFEGREVLFVRDVEYAAGLDEYYTRYPGVTMMSGQNYFEELMLSNAQKPIIDMAVNKITFKYEHPRILYIYDALLSSQLEITLACEHDTSLQSIEPTAAESFYQLAELDVMDALWNVVKNYEEMGGAYDRIALKIDEWKSAKEKREQLLKDWDEVYMLDQGNYDFG